MHERVVGPVQDDASLKSWRRQHSSVRELRKEGGKGWQRRDCAVGSLSDDYDYRDRGIPRVTFTSHEARAAPEVPSCGAPVLFSEGEAVDGGGRQYSATFWNQVSYVQTPQYFEDTPQLTIMGDPCGHKNTFSSTLCSVVVMGLTRPLSPVPTLCSVARPSTPSVAFSTVPRQKMPSRRCRAETVAAAMGQKKRWAKGAVQILLMKNESEVDPDGVRRACLPRTRSRLCVPRKMFFYDSVLYPFGSIPALCYVCTLSTTVRFSFSFITMMAIFEACQARITGKDKSWANTGAVSGGADPVLRVENATNPWNYVSAMFFGFFVMSQFYPMVKMSITEYCGWGPHRRIHSQRVRLAAGGVHRGVRAAVASVLRGQPPGGPGHSRFNFVLGEYRTVMKTQMTSHLLSVATWATCDVHAASSWPPGRRVQRVCVFEGFYPVPGATTTQPCPGTLPCPPGSYCAGGERRPCPAGVYGAEEGLRTQQCSAPCPEGFYCPEGTATPIECGAADRYCPLSSSQPEPVPEGSTHWVENRLTDVEAASVRAVQARFASLHLAEVSCRHCSADPCPAGTFGATAGSRTRVVPACVLSGLCTAGYYCPRGSTSDTQLPCGSVNVFCPPGSALPVQVASGYYTVGDQKATKDSLTEDALAAERDKDRTTRVAQRRCEPGHYCVDGERHACPAGTFGNKAGLTTTDCSGLCAAVYYCPEGSIVAQAVACATSAAFCPQGSALPTATAEGYCAVSEHSPAGARWISQRTAKAGEFAWRGTCYPCPAGAFGSEELETRPTCSGPCAAGYYCPPGSTTPTQRECGSASVYCPAASAKPWEVFQGYYTSLGVRAIPPNATHAPDVNLDAIETIPPPSVPSWTW
ncbi:uncharacterized protein KRP23_3019 [Phytophthora ramorum]|uniref:uncharacterized protein n=1 Tax=Phytophthora ramorum TaxID=164328 RepID=UPI0030AC8FC2|nr:hypothetical protein KRP23_3019 [Phytophthora ramorum]